MTRTERLLRLARLRGDRAAVAILETEAKRERDARNYATAMRHLERQRVARATESELRALWGDR